MTARRTNRARMRPKLPAAGERGREAGSEQDEVVAGLLRRMWVPPPAGHPFRPLSAMCELWAHEYEEDPPAAMDPVARPPSRKPNKFLADLTKAMQAAAEEARGRSLAQLQADAKTHVESIHGRSSTEAAGLRRAADDDVAAIREWSKAEIARIREETELRITDRKSQLETEIDDHAGVIERGLHVVELVRGHEDLGVASEEPAQEVLA